MKGFRSGDELSEAQRLRWWVSAVQLVGIMGSDLEYVFNDVRSGPFLPGQRRCAGMHQNPTQVPYRFTSDVCDLPRRTCAGVIGLTRGLGRPKRRGRILGTFRLRKPSKTSLNEDEDTH